MACFGFGRSLGALVSAAALSFSCGGDPSSDGGSADDGAAGGSGGAPAADDLPTSLRFDPTETLALAPREVRSLRIVAEPRGEYVVELAILPGPDSTRSNDASLDRSEVETDASGEAEVELSAPSFPTTFTLRASVGSELVTTLGVSVSDVGHATLRVVPSYTGPRQVERWTASVRAGTRCADLVGTPPPDGDLLATAPEDEAPVIEQVPVGAALAVTLRAGHFASGCSNIEALRPGETAEVNVAVSDRPLQLDKTSLAIEFEIEESTSDWSNALQAGIDDALFGMFAESEDDVVTLLAVMQGMLEREEQATEFAEKADALGFAVAVRGTLGTDATVLLRTVVIDWLKAGASNLLSDGRFSGRLEAAGSAGGQALFALERVGDADAEAAGFSPNILSSWTADPGDRVLLGATLYWLPSRLMAALAEIVALDEDEDAASAADALFNQARCDEIAASLGELVEDDEVVQDCNEKCIRNACRAAVETIWESGRDASLDPRMLRLSAGGQAVVDDMAVPIDFAGTWVGRLDNAEAASVSGSVKGQTALPNP
jgi:hypothetical protein